MGPMTMRDAQAIIKHATTSPDKSIVHNIACAYAEYLQFKEIADVDAEFKETFNKTIFHVHDGPGVLPPNPINTPGMPQRVFNAENMSFNAAWPSALDTGVELQDATTYTVIISGMSGTTGSTGTTANNLLPCILNGDGTVFGTSGFFVASSYAMSGLSNLYIQFRVQMRPVASDLSRSSFLLNSTVQQFGSVNYTRGLNMDLDSALRLDPGASNGPVRDFPTGVPQFAHRQEIETSNRLRLGFNRGAGTTTCNMNMLIRVIAQTI